MFHVETGTRTTRALIVAIFLGGAFLPYSTLASGPQVLGLRVYEDEFPIQTHQELWIGFNHPQANVCTLVPDDPCTTIGDLIAGSWDFSSLTSGELMYRIQSPVDSENTCYSNRCGFNLSSNDYLVRTDNLTAGSKEVSAIDQDGSNDTLWLRAAVTDEGMQGDSIICFDPGTSSLPAVPQLEFPNLDGARRYAATGDASQSDPFNCDQFLSQDAQCTTGGTDGWGSADATHAGQADLEVLDEGVVLLPSGHRLNALLARSVIDVALWVNNSCTTSAGTGLRQYRYVWLVPRLSAVVQITSPDEVPTLEAPAGWSTAQSTMISYGLLPPLSTNISDVDDTRITVDWNPGNVTTDIDRYKVHWDTDSGSSSAYAFDSDSNPGQVTFNGTSAEISGLSSNQSYFATVTILREYTAPASSTTVEYESLLFPDQVFGDPSDAYPQEVSSTTLAPGCTPTTEVSQLSVTKAGGDAVEICWSAVADGCHDHYRVIESDDATTGTGWMTAGETSATCFTTGVDATFFLSVSEGTGDDQGPWGHYGM